MLDIKLLREDPETVAQNLHDRNVQVFEEFDTSLAGARAATAKLAEVDRTYLDFLRENEEVARQQNQNSDAIRALSKFSKEEQAAKRPALIEEGKALRARGKDLEIETQQALERRDEVWGRVPNLTHPETPRGNTDDDHRVLKTWGAPRDFGSEGFLPKDHVAIAEDLQLVDFAAGAKVSGQKFYFLKNEGVLLDLALQQYAMQIAVAHGFTLHTTPDLARVEILQGLGFNPRGESTQVYSVANSDLCLVGTAEITLGGMLADEIFPESRLPILLCGLSHCFRTEAGAGGAESKGLYRVHQFTKVELFAVTGADLAQSEAMHAKLLAIEEEIFQGLGLPYRVLDIASGDLGGPAYRKFDIEAWMPGRSGYGEVTSTSNCTDFQSRRLKVRYRPESEDGGKAKPKLAHMLNGTAIATSRGLVAILENYQQKDGSVKVPQALVPWVGKSVIGGPSSR
jgi:seryl-tRNA synthetase